MRIKFILYCLLLVINLKAISLEQSLKEQSEQTNILSLEQALIKAKKAYPKAKNEQILDEALNLRLEKLYMNYIPHLKLNATASYQSQVPSLPISLPNYKGVPKDQYQANIELSQTILDSGNLWANEAINKANVAVQKASVQNDLYKVQEALINAFFNALLAQKQAAQNEIHLKELNKNLQDKKTKLASGVALPSDIDKIEIEILNTLKIKEEILALEKNALISLNLLLGEEVFTLKEPNLKENLAFVEQNLKSGFENRPEIHYFNLKDEEARARLGLERAKNLPYLEAYIKGGYGNPSLNFLKDEFSGYYVAGLRLNWDFSNLYTSKQQNELMRKELLLNASAKEEFILQNTIEFKQGLNNIKALYKQLKQNEQIISLQEEILKSSKNQHENGILSTNDLISDINKLNSLNLEKNYQEIELLLQIYKLKQMINSW